MTTEASAPGKVIVTGEHAVVYGEPAIVSALNRRLTVQASRAYEPFVTIDLKRTGRTLTAPASMVSHYARQLQKRWRRSGEAIELQPHEYAFAAVGEAMNRAQLSGMEITVGDELPVGAGLGSSASVAAAIVQAVSKELDAALDEPLQPISHRLERLQHGNPSGIDTEAVCQGGTLYAQKQGGVMTTEPLNEGVAGLHVFMTGPAEEGTGAMVEFVQQQRGNESAERAIEALGDSARAIREALSDGRQFEGSIRSAHRALRDLGVVPDNIQDRVQKLESDGFSAKISGAGARTGPGAGALLVYAPQDDPAAPNEHPALADLTHLTSDLDGDGVR